MPSVLVVEDDEVAREGMKGILEREGYEVALAGNGAEALDYLETAPRPDAILLDMLMPGVDGWGFLARVQLQPRLRAIPVILMTGTVLSPDWAASHGCAGFLKKPVKVADLLSELQRCAGPRRHHADTDVQAGE